MKEVTLEEAANKANGYNVYAKETKAPIFNEGFIAGAKWQQEQAKVTEKEQKIKMLKSFLHDLQMGEDVEDVEAWFEDYEKKQEQVKKELTSEEIPKSFFKPVLCEPIWNITNRTTKQQEQ